MKCKEALKILLKKFKREYIDLEIWHLGNFAGLYVPKRPFRNMSKNRHSKILIEPKQTLMAKLITCLHEYGHHKTHLKNKLKKRKDPNYHIGVTLGVVNHEVLAWQEGWGVAKRIGIIKNKKFCKAFFEDVKYSVDWYVSRFVRCPKNKIFK
jgi:hypothetical protein